jgi:hypothetical protein
MASLVLPAAFGVAPLAITGEDAVRGRLTGLQPKRRLRRSYPCANCVGVPVLRRKCDGRPGDRAAHQQRCPISSAASAIVCQGSDSCDKRSKASVMSYSFMVFVRLSWAVSAEVWLWLMQRNEGLG